MTSKEILEGDIKKLQKLRYELESSFIWRNSLYGYNFYSFVNKRLGDEIKHLEQQLNKLEERKHSLNFKYTTTDLKNKELQKEIKQLFESYEIEYEGILQ